MKKKCFSTMKKIILSESKNKYKVTETIFLQGGLGDFR